MKKYRYIFFINAATCKLSYMEFNWSNVEEKQWHSYVRDHDTKICGEDICICIEADEDEI